MARKPADQSVNRDEIIRAAADVLRRNGYDATTMKDIAAEVNLTAASLYHHFRNKASLLLAVLEGGLEQIINRLEPIAQSDRPAQERLHEMIALHIASLARNTAVGAAFVFEIKSLMHIKVPARNGRHPHNEETDSFVTRRDEFFERRDYFEKLFRDVVEQGIASGEFRQTDAAIFSKAIMGANNWFGVWYKDGGRLTGQEIGLILADTFLQSLLI